VNRILVVEDDPALRTSFRTGLLLEGFQVQEAGDGYTALQVLEAGSPPDVVVLDIGLPRVSGLAVLHELAAHPRLARVPVIVVTGLDEEADYTHAVQVLRKPVTMARLQRAILSALTARAAGHET
jgi:CheY-like chemotaxis protein